MLLVLLAAPPAGAIEPPVIDPAALPPDETGPDQPMEQRRICAAPTTFPNSNFADKPWANDYLSLDVLLRLGAKAVEQRVNEALVKAGAEASASIDADRERIDAAVAEITAEMSDRERE